MPSLYTVAHDFEAEDAVELSVKRGEVLVPATEDGIVQDGWIDVAVRDEPQRRGFVPIAYLNETHVEEAETRHTDDVTAVPAGSSPPQPDDTTPEQRNTAKPDATPTEPVEPATVVPGEEADSTPMAGASPSSQEHEAAPGAEGADVVTPPRQPQATTAATERGGLLVGTPHTEHTPSATVLRGKTVVGDESPIATAHVIHRAPLGAAGRGVSSEASPSPARLMPPEHTARLTDVQFKLQQIREAQKGNTLMSRYLISNSVNPTDPSVNRVDLFMQHVDPAERQELLRRRLGEGPSALRFKNRQLFRRKIVLLGYQEVGKTSLRKCFESEPYFFKSLPDVRTTTGVEVQECSISVDGHKVELLLSDFAGQEAYHSHTYFLTNRSIFGLVWKISAVEQDFNSNGINVREEERLYKWAAEIYAKFPRARIVLIATHLDELRVQGQRSVEMILNKVEGKIRTFLDRVALKSDAATTPMTNSHAGSGGAAPRLRSRGCTIVGNFAVSCKTRQIIAAGDGRRELSGEKISTLLRYLAQVAYEDCLVDREYPSAGIPGRHARLADDIEHLKRRFPEKLLMPIGEFVHMAIRIGVESDLELMQVARLLHSWDVIYLLNPHRLEDNLFVMLHPRWLSRMAASLFSFAHILRTPFHLRSLIGGLEYVITEAESADMCMMRKGYLRWPLARILFHRPLQEFLNRRPDDSDVAMCLELLQAMDILYEVEVPCDEFNVVLEETPVEPEVGRAVVQSPRVLRYYVPSLSPCNVPTSLRRLAPLLFHHGVRVKYEFNLLPDELWWRLQSKLHHDVQLVTVHQPAIVDDPREEEEMLLLEGYRLREADDEHNRWRDAMWLASDKCRVFVVRDSLTTIAIFSGETAPRGSEELLQHIEKKLMELQEEYEGTQRTTFVACPTPECDGWLSTDIVATHASVTCPACGQTHESDAVVTAGASPDKHFSPALLAEAGDFLSFCLSYRSCQYLCSYLGIPYTGPVPQNATPEKLEGDESPGSAAAHVEYLHALDKVVQAALFRSWMQRVEDREKRRRMLETEPSTMSPMLL